MGAVRRGRRIDLVIGVLLGLALGIALVVLFVFEFSEQTVDSPQLDEGRPPAEQPAEP